MHCTNDVEHIWAEEWGYSTIFGGSSSYSAGVGILLNNNFEFQILKKLSDPQGRFFFCDIKMQEKILTLVNIYTRQIFMNQPFSICYTLPHSNVNK